MTLQNGLNARSIAVIFKQVRLLSPDHRRKIMAALCAGPHASTARSRPELCEFAKAEVEELIDHKFAKKAQGTTQVQFYER